MVSAQYENPSTNVKEQKIYDDIFYDDVLILIQPISHPRLRLEGVVVPINVRPAELRSLP